MFLLTHVEIKIITELKGAPAELKYLQVNEL